MPGSDDYAQNVQYPKLSDAPNAETGFGTLVNDIVPLTNMVFANAASRAAAVPAPVAGMESYLIAEGRKEYFNGSAWTTITPGQWQPIPFATGYSGRAGAPSFRTVNGMVQLRGAVQQTSGLAMAGHAALTVVSALPTSVRPSETRWFLGATEWQDALYARVEVNPEGTVKIIIPSINPGPAWVSLDGVSYSLT